MTKKILNQNSKYDQTFLDKVEPKFEFSNKPINRLKVVRENTVQNKSAKEEKILNLKKKINSIKDCNLKDNSKNLFFIFVKKIYSPFYRIFPNFFIVTYSTLIFS